MNERPPPPPLARDELKRLRKSAHHLEPVVRVGVRGVTDAVIASVDEALERHELIKVRLAEPEDKRAMADELATRSGAALCGLIGHTAILFRPRAEDPAPSSRK